MPLFEDPAMVRALSVGMCACIACGVVGSYVVVKRLALISGGVSHASLGGVGIAAYMGFAPILGAMTFGLASAVLIGVVSLKSRETEDTLIAALWAAGMSIGVVFLQITPGAGEHLEEYLFGDILNVWSAHLIWTLVLDVVIVGIVALCYKELFAVSFDEEYAELRGVPVAAIYVLLLCLIAITIVLMIRVVGVILLIALLTIPSSMARWFTNRFAVMMALSAGLGATFVALGITLAHAWALPPGPTIVLLASMSYATGLVLQRWRARREAVARY